MRSNIEHLKFIFFFCCILCHNASNAAWNDSPITSRNQEENSNTATHVDGTNSEVKLTGENSDFNEHALRINTGNNEHFDDSLESETLDKMYRHKRSTYLIVPFEEPSKSKRIFSDYGYGSRLQTEGKLAQLVDGERFYGAGGPGKRSAELSDIELLNMDNEIISNNDKRIASDYGYGSRLKAVENMANSWQKDNLFGVHGPGKRSFSTDFGYGARNQAGGNVANTVSRRTLFGSYGPGKRSGYANDDIDKRISTDYGYGSRIKALENVASSANSGLFGIHGPGKRSADSFYLFPSKRIVSDFGYGSREQIAETLAHNSDRDNVFGVYGPGKRSADSMSADSGYGSRIGAGSQVARDMAFINDVFGQFGPGRRRRSAFY